MSSHQSAGIRQRCCNAVVLRGWFVVLLLLCLSATSAMAADDETTLPTFPGAEGFGAYTVGGRGGRVLEVTNLNDSGPGSLRAAIRTSGPRTVIFKVAGTIRLLSDLKITEPYLTIAGQTAPAGGITLRDHSLVVEASEVVVRYLRVRLGDESRTESDAVSITAGRNIILDHVSAGWSVDETLSISQRLQPGTVQLDNVTVQWSIIAESLNQSLHSKGEHGYGSLIRGAHGSRYSLHHNLWAHHRARMPRPGNYQSAADDPVGPLMDFRNNVFYNWGGSYAGYNADEDAVARYNFVANYYLRGTDSSKTSLAFEEHSTGARAFFADNAMDGAVPAPWLLVRVKNSAIDLERYRATAAFDVAKVNTQSPEAALQSVLAGAGQRCWRDPVDQRVVQSVTERTGRLINSQRDVGGWPLLPTAEGYQDSDHDGISDVWERGHGLNPGKAQDAAMQNEEGYTNLEVFLNELAAGCQGS